MAECACSGQTVVSGCYALFRSSDGEVKRFYALESSLKIRGTDPTYPVALDDAAADIAATGQAGVLRWNPTYEQFRAALGLNWEPRTPIVVPIAGGDAAAVKAQILAGGATRVKRFVPVDGKTLEVTVTQRLWPPFAGAKP